MARSVLTFDKVSKTYRLADGRLHHALHRVDAGIPEGSRIAVIGRSGIGKSTFLHLAAGRQSDRREGRAPGEGSRRPVGGGADGEAGRMAEAGKTPVFVAIDGRVEALLAVADPIKPSSKDAVSAMKRLRLRVVMLTGDHERTAAAVAREAGIDEVVAGVLPEGKVAEIARRQAAGEVVAMVGDGINDALPHWPAPTWGSP